MLSPESALVSLSNQTAPLLCDWGGDGDLDLLVGHGYGTLPGSGVSMFFTTCISYLPPAK